VRDTLGSRLTETAGWDTGSFPQREQRGKFLSYRLKVTTSPKRDWKTLWFLYSSEEYTITLDKDSCYSDLMNMIGDFEKFDCSIKVLEIPNG
jgi:hypothetical protein